MSTSDSTSDQGSAKSTKSGSGGLVKWVGLVVTAIVVSALVVWYRGGGGGDEVVDDEIQQRLELTRVALAATENLEAVEADAAWTQLFTQTPGDTSIALNRAINRILRVDDLTSQATNASLEESEKMAARAQLPEAITAAREAVDDYTVNNGDAAIAMWLQTRVDLHEASLLPGSRTKSLRREAYQRLSEVINGPEGGDPLGIMLGGTLISVVEQLEDPIDGLPPDLLADAAKTVAALSNQYPDNLYFALRAARFAISTKNMEAVQYVRRASELAKAIEPSIRRETAPIGVTPDELVNQITEAIESGKWSEAENRILLWFNVLNSTEIVKTDRRRATPHPLDILSFESLRRLSSEMVAASPLPSADSQIVFSAIPTTSDGQARAVTTVDFDLDLDPDLVTLTPDNRLQLWSNDGKGGFNSISELQIEFDCSGMIVADLFLVDSSNPSRLRTEREVVDSENPDFGAAVRHDTFQSLVVFGTGGMQLVGIDGRASTDDATRLQAVSSETGLENVRDVVQVLAGDLEADGDLDLVVSTQSQGVRLFANRGNQSFFELVDALSDFGQEDPAASMAIVDIDRDLDLDVVTAHPGSGRIGLIENLLHLQFRGRYLEEVPAIAGADSIYVEDVDGNVSWDLIVGGRGGAVIVYSQTADAGAWTVEQSLVSEQDAAGMVVADFDNDSWMDLLVPSGGRSQWCRIGPWGFSPWSMIETATGVDRLTTGDFDRDGAIDVAGITDSTLAVRRNQTADMGHYLDVRFKGIDDNVSGRVNHFAIGSVLELRFGPHYRARIVRSPSTHFGLDGYDSAGSVRAILPNGLTQTIREPAVDSLVEEEQTLKGSCPYLYCWDGEKFVFKTDCLWAAPLGLQVAHGVVAKDRPWEYLKIDGADVRPVGDHYEFRITEELWEVAYFDQVDVSVVDHPADVEVWTNEKVGPGNIATPTIFAFASEDVRPLVSAQDTFGRDISDQLRKTDQDYVQAFDRRLRQGLCPPHWIDLDFGNLSDRVSTAEGSVSGDQAKVYLVLTGWIMPTDTSLNIQIDQNPDLGPVEFPSVWVPDASESEGWRQAIPFMGFPGGKTKTIVVDVTDVINWSDPRFRVRTSAQIYWDRAAIALQSKPAPFHQHSLSLLDAEVARHGFSARIRDDLTHPEVYDYQQSSLTPRWPPLSGDLTRLGDCTDLVRQWDDRMVVIGAGDEIRMKFSTPSAAPPEGWKRDFVVHSVGWDKDADLNTLAGQSIGPLPYRGMAAYPPTAGERAKAEQVQRLNRSHLQRSQAFRDFWYRSDPN